MEESFRFFDDMRTRMLEESQIKIAQWYRRLKRERLERQEREKAELERKAKIDKKKKRDAANSKN